MIDRRRLTPKMLEEFEKFEPKYAKGIAQSVSIYILGTVPLIIAVAVATKKMIELGMEYKKFKNASK